MSRTPYRGLKGLPSYEVTPFIELPGVVYKKHLSRSKSAEDWVDPRTGEIGAFVKAKYGQQYFADDALFIKLFKEDMIPFRELPSPTLQLLMWIFQNIKRGSEEVTIIPRLIVSDLGYKGTKNVYGAIADLCDKRILAKKAWSEHDYFINPAKFFNGTREKLMDAEVRSEYAIQLKNNTNGNNNRTAPSR